MLSLQKYNLHFSAQARLFYTSSLPLSPLLVNRERCLKMLYGASARSRIKDVISHKRMETAGFDLAPSELVVAY